MSVVYIGLGSNLADPTQQVLQAIEDIKGLEDSVFIDASSLYQTPPMGPQDQPNYINAVVKINTALEPLALLTHLQAIETLRGRTRNTGRWGARTLDLDVLVYEGTTSNDPQLTLPHPGIALRNFVLYPLSEINSQLTIDGLGSVAQLIKRLNEASPAIIHVKTLDLQASV